MPDPMLTPPAQVSPVSNIIVRLADEGVPVAAIARSTQWPADEVRDVLRDAVEHGSIISVPAADWPPGQERSGREPVIAKRSSGLVDDSVVFACVRAFHVTKLQASVLAVLIKRKEASKDTLHQVIEQRRAPNSDETDPKMVDVVICHLRKRLKPFNMTITTVWSCGYYLEAGDRLRAAEMLATLDAPSS